VTLPKPTVCSASICGKAILNSHEGRMTERSGHE
jgi:hypothetical protein